MRRRRNPITVRRGLPHYAWFYLLLLCCIAVPADARTLVVGREGAFSTIRQAVAEALEGDTIEVHSGTYDGNVVLDRSVSLIGMGAPVIRGGGNGSIVTVLGDHCTLRGLVIEHSGGMLVDEDSGILLKSNGNRVEHNELRDVLYGIYLLASNDNQIVSNVIRGRPLADLGSRGSGIHVWNSSNNLFAYNTITDARDGMYLQNAYYTLVRGNRIYGLRYGLHYMFSDDNTFEDNISYDNVAGAAIMYSKRVQFRRNVFLHNRGFSSFGILFQDVEHCTAEDNMISDNAVGLFMEGLRNSNLRHNLISANDVAMQLFQSATDNTFEENNFVENLSPMEVIGGHTSNHWRGRAAGNYWSDYDGYDLDDDGVGDVPYSIYNVFQQLEGDYPRLRIFLYSPAAQALALAERGFPVLRRESELDERPLMRAVPMSFQASGSRDAKGRVPGMFWPALMLLVSIVGYGRGVKS